MGRRNPNSENSYSMSKRNVAVLFDIENINDTDSVKAVLDESNRLGQVAIKCAVGNWGGMTEKMQTHLTKLGIKFIRQASAGKGSNSSDMRLAIEVMDLLHDQSNPIDVFVLTTSDADFVPLATRLRSTGSYVVGCGYASSTDLWRSSVDKFVTLGIAATHKSHKAEPDGKEATSKSNLTSTTLRATEAHAAAPNEELHDEQRRLMRQALIELSKEHHNSVLGAKLHARIRELIPGFNYKKLGHSSFKKFVKSLDFTKVPDKPKTGDFRVSLRNGK